MPVEARTFYNWCWPYVPIPQRDHEGFVRQCTNPNRMVLPRCLYVQPPHPVFHVCMPCACVHRTQASGRTNLPRPRPLGGHTLVPSYTEPMLVFVDLCLKEHGPRWLSLGCILSHKAQNKCHFPVSLYTRPTLVVMPQCLNVQGQHKSP